MYTKKKCGWDRKMDLLIGPGTKMQVLSVRSLTGLFKFPFFYEFDRRMTKALLLQIIHVIEAIGFKNLLSVCDQGGLHVLYFWAVGSWIKGFTVAVHLRATLC
jgi:hypothetical protein